MSRLVPEDLGRDIYLVFDNFGGALGRAWGKRRRAGQIARSWSAICWKGSPVCIIAFNLDDDLQARKEQALVVVTLSTATLIACFSLMLASL